MSFAVFADGSANLPKSMLEGIALLPCDYTINGVPHTYLGDIDYFDGHSYYEMLREGVKVSTSLLNTQLFIDTFTSVLEQGIDIIYVSMSSGISGTYNAAKIAADELMETFPGRFVHIVDSHGCGFGNGLLAVHAAKLSKEGVDVKEAAKIIDEEVPHMCQYFTVDDLNFLKNTGRVSGVTAKIATMLNIKPILYGNKEGQIVACEKVRGRRKSIDAIVKHYKEKFLYDVEQTVCISHGDCLEDAKLMEQKVLEVTPDAKIVICQHEPFSGSHVGPGMLALFFLGKER